MGIPVLITGKSGSGKSTSLRNFGEEEIGIINVVGKPMPFRKQFKYIKKTDSYAVVKAFLTKCPVKSIVIDDAGYLMTNQFMKGHASQGAGNAIYSFYNQIGDDFWQVLISIINTLPEDVIVYIIMHEDTDDFGNIKPKTIGKMLDEKVNIPGMFTLVLRSVYENGSYFFKTNTDGIDVCKTPMGMFEEKYIDNDLKAVDETIRKYYEI